MPEPALSLARSRRRAIAAGVLVLVFLGVTVATSVATLGAACNSSGTDSLVLLARARGVRPDGGVEKRLPAVATGCALPHATRDASPAAAIPWTAPVVASGPHATATFALG